MLKGHRAQHEGHPSGQIQTKLSKKKIIIIIVVIDLHIIKTPAFIPMRIINFFNGKEKKALPSIWIPTDKYRNNDEMDNHCCANTKS